MAVSFFRLRETKGFVDAAGFTFVVHQYPRVDLIDQDVFDGGINPYIFLADLRTGVRDTFSHHLKLHLSVFQTS